MSKRFDRNDIGISDSLSALTECAPEFAYLMYEGRDTPARWPLDSLPCYEVVFVLEGRLTLWMGGEAHPGKAGDVFVVPPRTAHREETPPGQISEVFYLGVTFRGANGRQRRFPVPLATRVHLPDEQHAAQRLREIAAEIQQRAPGYTAMVQVQLTELFCLLARAAQGITVPPADLGVPQLGRFGDQVRAYIQQHYAEPLSVAQMAHHFRVSRQYFSRLFQRATGQGPHAYLTAVRLEKAKELMADPELPVRVIATRAGFEDPCYFAKTFRRHTGLTPSAYREHHTGS